MIKKIISTYFVLYGLLTILPISLNIYFAFVGGFKLETIENILGFIVLILGIVMGGIFIYIGIKLTKLLKDKSFLFLIVFPLSMLIFSLFGFKSFSSFEQVSVGLQMIMCIMLIYTYKKETLKAK